MGHDVWKNRSRIEIIGKILSVCVNGLKKTHIMYKVNLSYKQLCEYLEFLEQSALLEPKYDDDGQKIFRTALKGMEFLEYYGHLNSLARIPMEYEPETKAERELSSYIEQ